MTDSTVKQIMTSTRLVCQCYDKTPCNNCYHFGTRCLNCAEECCGPLVEMTWEQFITTACWNGETVPKTYTEFVKLYGKDWNVDATHGDLVYDSECEDGWSSGHDD